MTSAVIFDWFGTLARWEHEGSSNYLTVLRGLGYEPDPDVIDAYHVNWDGVDHRHHSTSKGDYLAWTRGRLRGLTRACEISSAEEDEVITALIELGDGGPMVLYPDPSGARRAAAARFGARYLFQLGMGSRAISRFDRGHSIPRCGGHLGAGRLSKTSPWNLRPHA